MSFNKPIREAFGTELYFISSIEPFAYKHCDEVCENKSSSYVNDFDGHWKTCSCGYGHDFGYHEDENGDGKCDVCDFRFY